MIPGASTASLESSAWSGAAYPTGSSSGLSSTSAVAVSRHRTQRSRSRSIASSERIWDEAAAATEQGTCLPHHLLGVASRRERDHAGNPVSGPQEADSW